MENNIIKNITRCELKENNELTNKNKKYLDHFHDFYELCVVLNDDVSFITDSSIHKMSDETLIIIPPFKYHHVIFDNEKDYKRLIVWFQLNNSSEYEHITKHLNDVFIYNYSNDDFIKRLINNFRNIARKLEKKNLIKASEGFLLSFLYQLEFLPILSNDKEKEKINPIIESVVEYINDNLERKITLKELTSKFSISLSYLEKIFKDTMHISIINYIKEKQLFMAKSLIFNGVNPTIACYKCGFQDYTSFYKCFKKRFNMSPKEVKEKKE